MPTLPPSRVDAPRRHHLHPQILFLSATPVAVPSRHALQFPALSFFPVHSPPNFSVPARSSRSHTPYASLQQGQQEDGKHQYVPLHVHSDFSLLDGASQLPSLVDRAQQLGVPALALTDHGVLYGAVQLVRTCRDTDVKPIIGNEMYIVNSQLPLPESGEKPPKRYHLIVLAKNTVGYRNLVKLTTMAHLDGKVGKGIFARPCVNKAQLYAHRHGLLVSSACLGGEIPQAILNDDIDAARRIATWYRDTFRDDFYLEIQDHGSEEDRRVNPVMVQLSRELGIRLIATNDSHFTTCLDAEAHDAMICIQTGKLLTDENRLHYAGNEYFKSVEEMRQCFVDHLPPTAVDDALRNTMEVAHKVETYDLFGATRIPDFPIPSNVLSSSHDDYLRVVAREGMGERLRVRVRSGLLEGGREEVYMQRLEEELDMICRMGFSSYFLVVWDYIKYAREVSIPVGPGRGSAAGSLVAFALRITDVDPIHFNLLFERFLNPERKSMPDIDTDFSVDGRERIIAYVTERYGRDRVAQIITFNRLTSKAVLKDMARVHDVPYSMADRLAKLIPVVRGKPATLSEMVSKQTPSREFKALIEKNEGYGKWLDKAQRIEGANKTFGIHAAGVVISAAPLTDIVPLSKAKHGETITQYAMEDVEALGLLKMDFLGLKNLTVIETALEFINQGRRAVGIAEDLDFSVDELPLDDPKTYKLLAEGGLDGIFQLDASAGMRRVVREMRPSSLEDISSILALYRPGPLDAGLIPKFIRRKHGVDPIEYEHPLLEPILKDTYGIMVYQEQIMRIARDLAGYSLGQADILRRAMGKKKMKEMEKEKPKFVKGAKQCGVDEKIATNLFDQMLKFADYCFNKSHSTAYAYLTYQTAYLKANYPVEYCAALLRSNMNQSDKLVRYLADANLLGVRVKPPSVNRSSMGFTVDRSEGDGPVVLFGLEAVKTVGESVSTALIEEREKNGPFINIIDLIERVDLRVLNKRAVGSLIQAGAFDELHPNRKVLLENLDPLLLLRRKLRDKRKRREAKNLSDEDMQKLNDEESQTWEEAAISLATDSAEMIDFTTLERLGGEKATLGFYASGHPLYDVQNVSRMLGCTPVAHIIGDSDDVDTRSHDHDDDERSDALSHHVNDGAEVLILSCVTDLKRMTTAKGKKMAKWTIEDLTGRMSAVVFPGTYDVMEQTVPCEEGINADEEKSALVEEEKLQYVVEEDARVLVWGRVDRSSAGTAQLIVDDVQRVEDAHVVIAKATLNGLTSHVDFVGVLKSFAADVLNISTTEERVGIYFDANGERQKGRRKKSPPLAEKRRVPLVLESVDSGGTLEFLNAGNAVRFPLECSREMERLAEVTGCKVQLFSVGKELMNQELSNSAMNGKVLRDVKPAPIGRDSIDGGVYSDDDVDVLTEDTDANVTKTKEPETTSIADCVPMNEPSSVDSGVNGQNELLSLEAGSSATPSTNEVSQDYVEPKTSGESTPKTSGNGTTEESTFETDIVSVGGVQVTRREYDEILAAMEANKRPRQVTESSKDVSDAEQALSYIRSLKVGRDTFHFRDFSRPKGLQDLKVHDVFHSEEKDIREKVSAVAVATSANDVAEHGANVSGISSMSNATMREVWKHDVSEYGASAIDEGLHSVLSSGSGGAGRATDTRDAVSSTLGGAARRVADIDTRESLRDEVSPLFNVTSSNETTESIQATASTLTSKPIVQHHAHSSQEPLPLTTIGMGNESSSSGDDSTNSPSRRSASVIDLSDGYVVDFDEMKLAGVLDTVCVVASDVAAKRSNRRHVITCLSALKLDNLTERGVSLRISGRVTFANDKDIYVLVDVRETEASGKRKRVRSFGPISVVLRTEQAVAAVSLNTKKAKKAVETFLQKIANCRDSTVDSTDGGVSDAPVAVGKGSSSRQAGLTTVNSSEVGVSLLRDVSTEGEAAGDSTHLLDGGEIVAYMARAAEVCAGNVLTDVGEGTVVLMEWLTTTSDMVWKNVQRMFVRTHLEGLSFGTLKIQVEAEVVISDEGDVCHLRAMFGACCRDGRLLRRVRVLDDDIPLFSRGEALAQMGEVEQRLQGIV